MYTICRDTMINTTSVSKDWVSGINGCDSTSSRPVETMAYRPTAVV